MSQRCLGNNSAIILKNDYLQLTGRSRAELLAAAIQYTTTATTVRPPNALRTNTDYIAFKKAQILAASAPPVLLKRPQQSIIVKELQEFGFAQRAARGCSNV
jgi:hypothetical protein